MNKRPNLDRHLDSATFRSYYYLKEELVSFCRSNGMPAAGGKMELTDRIAHFLDTGEVWEAKKTARTGRVVGSIEEDNLIEPDFVCTEKHRAFFSEKVGRRFSFNVAFQKWLKANAGKTYAEAIEAYHRIVEEKRSGITTIDRQFEYNTYIRDFFEDNKGRPLEQAIRCWRYKKGLPGHNRYDKADLIVLEEY